MIDDAAQNPDAKNELPPPGGEGWQTTNSHPAKPDSQVSEAGRVLAAGFDTLNVAIDLRWHQCEFFNYLHSIKEQALGQEVALQGNVDVNGFQWIFNVEPYGMRGYAYILRNSDYLIKLGAWTEPKSRPSALVEVRSQALWACGEADCIDQVVQLLNAVGATIIAIKASRVDACVDILVPNSVWNSTLRHHRVCRSHALRTHEVQDRLTGFEIGSGGIRARLYDKAEEIKVKSNKTWMYDIWKLESVPPHATVVRVEFQLRREVLRELGIDSVWDLLNHPRNVWTYCTRDWLKFMNDPKLHFDNREVMPWWKSVQDGFHASEHDQPLLRAKIVQVEKKKLAQQFVGQFSSLIALDCNTNTPRVRLEEQLPRLSEAAELLGVDDDVLSYRVERKVAKYKRGIRRFCAMQEQRKALGFPHLKTKSIRFKLADTEEEVADVQGA